LVFENLSPDQVNALEKLGDELKAANWTEDVARLDTLRMKDRFNESVMRAIAFIEDNKADIQGRLCKDRAVKLEVQAAGAGTAAVTDALVAMSGVPIPISSLANVLCMLGLGKFCQWQTL
jgi:hypothetical protein